MLVLPNCIAWSGLHQWFINRAAAGFNGQISVRRATLGWFQPVVLEGVQATDREGKTLFTAERIAVANRLGAVLWSRNPGLITIDQPVLNACLRADGSNIEDAISAWMAPNGAANSASEAKPGTTGSPASRLPAAQLAIRNGTVQLDTASGGQQQTLESLTLDLTAGGKSALDAAFRFTVRQMPGSDLQAALTVAGDAPQGQQAGRFEISAAQFPLAALGPVLVRLAGPGVAEGLLSGKASGEWTSAGEVALSLQQLAAQSVRLSGRDLLGPDTLALERLSAAGEARLNRNGLAARQLIVHSELGHIRADGEFPWRQLTRLVNDGQLAHAPFQLDGEVDLARLGAVLPGLLRLHEDLRLESGALKFNVATRKQNEWPGVLVNIDTINLSARRNGQRIAWQQPLRIVASAIQRDGQLVIEELVGETGMLEIRGAGQLSDAHFQVAGDLDRAFEQLEQFVDLGGWRIGGALRGELSCRAESSGGPPASAPELIGRPIRIAADLQIDRATIHMPGIEAWSEPSLRLVANATAQAQPSGALLVMQGIGQMMAGEERASLRLTQPIPDLFALKNIEGEAAASGKAERWLTLLRHFADPGSFDLRGTGNCTASVRMTPSRIDADDLKYAFAPFALDGWGLNIREDQVSGAGGLTFDIPAGRLTARNLTLVSSSVAALADQTSLTFGPRFRASGNLALRGDVNRILGWFGWNTPAATVQYFGGFEGTIGFGESDGFVDGTVRGVFTDLVAARPDQQARRWVELAREPRATVEGQIGMSDDWNRLRFRQLRLAGRAISTEIAGEVRDIAGTFDMDLTGNWQPDWQQINGLLGSWSHDLVRLRGSESQRFAIRGPLFAAPGTPAAPFLPASTQVATELKWEQGNVFLLPVGPAHLQARLMGSQAEVDTGEISFAGGTLQARPRIDLAESATVLTLAPGELMRKVQLTPQFCRDWMKYVAPLLADVTTAEGSLSVRTGDVRIPFDQPEAATADGVVILHNVTVGAGPLAQQLLSAVESVRTLLRPDAAARDRSVWMNLGEQEVPFALRDGRIWHNGLRLQARDLVVTTRGSVGLDQSLQMVATIPIHEDWLNGQRWLEGLRGQQIEIPIGGTVSHPVLDPRAIQQLSLQLVQRTAQSEIGRVVGDQAQQLQQRAAGEVQEFQQKIQEKLQNEVRDRVPGQIFQGLNNLFGAPPPQSGGGTPPGG